MSPLRSFLTALLALAPAPLRGQSGAAAEIRAARLAQNAALADRRMDSVASFWTSDVVITTSLGRVRRGKEAYREALTLDSGTVYVRTPTRIEPAKPWPSAWEEGEWMGKVRAGGQVIIRGRYAAQWHRVGGRWLIRSELFVGLACSGAGCERPLVTPDSIP